MRANALPVQKPSWPDLLVGLAYTSHAPPLRAAGLPSWQRGALSQILPGLPPPSALVDIAWEAFTRRLPLDCFTERNARK